MSSTMSVAEDKFEDVYVKDMVDQCSSSRFETRVVRFMYDKFNKYSKEKNPDFRRRLAVELKRARKFLKYRKEQRIKCIRRVAKRRFRSMSDKDKRLLAAKYKSRGFQSEVCNMYLNELDAKANAHQRAGLSDMEETDKAIKSSHDSWEVIEERKKREEEERLRKEEEERQRLAAMTVTAPLVVEYDLSGLDYAKKREDSRKRDTGRQDDRSTGREIGFHEETVSADS